jgi:hypothetical protein
MEPWWSGDPMEAQLLMLAFEVDLGIVCEAAMYHGDVGV